MNWQKYSSVSVREAEKQDQEWRYLYPYVQRDLFQEIGLPICPIVGASFDLCEALWSYGLYKVIISPTYRVVITIFLNSIYMC